MKNLHRLLDRSFRIILISALLINLVPAWAYRQPASAAALPGVVHTTPRTQFLPAAPEAVSLSAAQTDSLAVDVDSDSKADPGDTLKYTITAANSGATEGLSVQFDELLDANLTFVPGSLSTAPIARADSYTSIGNLDVSINEASGLLLGAASLYGADSDPDGGTVSVVTGIISSTQGGNVILYATGAFDYYPPSGFTGDDTFEYTIVDDESQTDKDTATITLSSCIWFIDGSAPAGGTGTQHKPFATTGAFNTANTGAAGKPKDNDLVYLAYNAGGSYDGGLVLRSGQMLYGQGVDFAATSGLSAPLGAVLPTAGGAPTIINTTANNTGAGIYLNFNNTIKGLVIGSTTGAGLTSSAGLGTLSVGSVTINGTGAVLKLTHGGTLAAQFDNLSTTSANSGSAIQISGATSGSLTVADNAGVDLAISGVNTSYYAIDISGAAAGAVFTFNDASISGAVRLTANNNSGTVLFKDLDLTAASASPVTFSAANTRLEVLSGAWQNLDGQVISLNTVVLTANGLTLDSLSATGGTAAITLSSVSGGAFSILGGGASNASVGTRGRTTSKSGGGSLVLGAGGTLSGQTQAAVILSSVSSPVILRNMVLQNGTTGFTACGSMGTPGASGICGASSSGGLTLDNLSVSGFGGGFGLFMENSAGLNIVNSDFSANALNAGVETNDVWGMRLTNLTGTSLVKNTRILTAYENLVGVSHTAGTGTLTFSNCEIRDTNVSAPGNAALAVSITGGTLDLTVQSSSLTNGRSRGLQVLVNGSGGGSLLADGNTIKGSFTAIDLAHQASTNYHYTIRNNLINTDNTANTNTSTALNLLVGTASIASTILEGYLGSNTIGNPAVNDSGSYQGAGMNLEAKGAGTLIIEANNNSVYGIRQDGAVNVYSGSSALIHFRASGNYFSVKPTVAGTAFEGLYFQTGDSGGPNSDIICARLSANTRYEGITYGAAIVNNTAGTIVRLEGYAGAANNTAQIAAFLNTTAATVTPSAIAFVSGGTITSGFCQSPSFTQPAGLAPVIMDNPGAPSEQETAAQVGLAALVPAGEPAQANPAGELNPAGTASTLSALRQQSGFQPAAPLPDTSIVLGVVPPGKHITITLQAVVNNPLPWGAETASSQGTFTMSNGADVMTDDPDVAGAANPTQTALDAAPILALGANDGGVTAVPGGLILYTLTYTNTGNQGANVTAVFTVPLNTSYAASSLAGSCVGGVCSFAAGELPGAGASSTITVSVQVDSSLPAWVFSIQSDSQVRSSPDHAEASLTTNLDVSRQCGFTPGHTYTFNPGGGVITMTMDALNDLVCIDTSRLAGSPPDKLLGTNPNMTDGHYWVITATNEITETSGFSITLELPYSGGVNPSICVYTAGPANGWDCTGTQSHTASTVTRSGMDHFSIWAVGYGVGPTAVRVADLHTRQGEPAAWLLAAGMLAAGMLAAGMLAAMTAWLAHRRRR